MLAVRLNDCVFFLFFLSGAMKRYIMSLDKEADCVLDIVGGGKRSDAVGSLRKYTTTQCSRIATILSKRKLPENCGITAIYSGNG